MTILALVVAKNYEHEFLLQLPDVKKIINEGCRGFAAELMRWPTDLIVARDGDANSTQRWVIFNFI